MPKSDFAVKRTDLEDRIQELVGRRIIRVRYYEIPYADGQPWYRQCPFDSIDFGLDLETDSSNTFCITWDDSFFSFGVTVRKESLAARLPAYRVWDLSDDELWASNVGQRISEANLYWAEAWDKRGQGIAYPQDLELVFENGEMVVFAAAMFDANEDQLLRSSDQLAVIFGKGLAQAYQLGRHAM